VRHHDEPCRHAARGLQAKQLANGLELIVKPTDRHIHNANRMVGRLDPRGGDTVRARSPSAGRSRHDPSDVRQRRPEITQPADHLRDQHLGDRLVPVAAAQIDRGRLEEPDLVVMPLRLALKNVIREEAPMLTSVSVTPILDPPAGGESRPAFTA
jgi:hypothetical protein